MRFAAFSRTTIWSRIGGTLVPPDEFTPLLTRKYSMISRHDRPYEAVGVVLTVGKTGEKDGLYERAS